MNNKHLLSILSILVCLAACQVKTNGEKIKTEKVTPTKVQVQNIEGLHKAYFASGCFWCVESDFEKLPGVYEVVSGYSGGDMPNPTYRNHGKHVEVAKVIFDPTVVSYDQILDHYWTHVDPTDDGGQFCDRGHAYIPVIYARPDQMETAENSKADIMQTKPFSDPIKVPVLAAKMFWDAEDYHQDYYKKNPIRYKYYRGGCGRDKRLEKLWGKPKKG